jgi:FkbM family methyltransferase
MKLPRLCVRAIQKLILPVLPKGRRLPIEYLLHIAGGNPEPELRYFEEILRICPRHEVAIDVGANQGLFSYRMAPLFSKVFAFEINARLVAGLADWNPGNVEIRTTGLSSASGEATLFIPVMNGIRLDSWGSLKPGNCPGAGDHVKMPVRVETLDSFGIAPVSFIKIDVEGHELSVLRGAIKTLKESRPVLLVEVKEPNIDELRSFLAGLDYSESPFNSPNGDNQPSENRIFVPNEDA